MKLRRRSMAARTYVRRGVLALALMPAGVRADNVIWDSSSDGLFSDPANWLNSQNAHVVPGAGDYVIFGPSPYTSSNTVTLTANVDVQAVTAEAGNMTIDGGSYTMSMGNNFYTPFDVGAYTGQTASLSLVDGTFDVSPMTGSGPYNQAIVGDFANTNGVLNIGTGAIVQTHSNVNNETDAGAEIVGNSGNGTINQTAGSNSVGLTHVENIYLAVGPGSVGFFNLSGGSLNVSGNAYVGGNSNGAGGTGTLAITGSFNASAPTSATIAGTLKIYSGGSVNLSGNAVLNVGTLDTSSSTPAAFVNGWTGGTLNITGPNGLNVGNGQPLGAIVSILPGQTLNVTNTLTNLGVINLNGGSLSYGAFSGYAINWTKGQLTESSLNQPLTIGSSQTFGSPQVVTTITSSGSITVNAGGAIGGSINNSGTVVTAGDFVMANQAQYLQNTNTGSTTINGNFAVGANGSTGSAQTSAGSFTANEITLGSLGGSGSFTMSGTADVKVVRGIQVNDYVQNGGTTTVMGQNPNDGGDPEITGAMVGGYQHNGAMYLNGGTASTIDLKLGITAGMTGTYQQTSGVITISHELGAGYDPMNAGGAGVGVASMMGGTTNAASAQIGSAAGGVGTVNVSGTGAFNVSGPMQIVNGNFNQTGGSTTVTGVLGIGNDGSTGAAFVSAGNFNASTISLGSPGGSGSFSESGTANVLVVRGISLNDYVQNGGTTTVMGQNPNDGGDPELTGAMVGGYLHNGAMYLNGGTANTIDLKLGITSQMTGTYQQTSGVMNISGKLAVGYDPMNGGGAGIGVANISGGITNAAYVYGGSVSGGTGNVMVQTGGMLNVSAGINVIPGSGLSVGAGGTVNLMPHAGSGTASVVSALSVSTTGRFDLSNNALDVPNGVTSSLRASIAEAYAKGLWTGYGLTSSTAAADTTHLTAIGLIQNNQSGVAIYTSGHLFDGIAPGAGDLLLKYTYVGDANLDGKVDGSDYSLIDSGYLTHASTWYGGDFNYDGVVNGSDYTLIDNAFNRQGAQIDQSVAGPEASITAEVSSQATSVPEPIALSAVAATGLLVRRSRKTR